MPFRLTNAPATFQWLMETCHEDLNLNWCIIYLDDIIIFSEDPASHLERLEAMFQKQEQAWLKLKPSTCELFQEQITYLGHIVSAQGIATNESKTETIKIWPTPNNVTEVRSFPGFMGYYRWFIQSSHSKLDLCMNLPQVKMQARRKWLSCGMTDVSSPLMT